jgi:hypothetical protein
MTSLAPLVYLLVALGIGFNVAVAIACTVEDRKRRRRVRRQQAVARELNSRRWHFANQIAVKGRGNGRVSCEDRWGRAA